jgi:hypothetical protein
MKKKIAKVISIISVVAVYALIIMSILYLAAPAVFGNSILWFLTILICVSFVPVLAYPFSHVIPKIKAEGRDGQRKLAFIFAVCGYIAGFLIVLLFHPPLGVSFILLTYFISGILLSFINKILHIKASGHSCGVTAPTFFIIIYLGIYFLPMLLVLPIVYWSRLTLGRHTIKQLFLGSAVSIAALLISYLFCFCLNFKTTN